LERNLKAGQNPPSIEAPNEEEKETKKKKKKRSEKL
jgi:hypothetical protein